MPRKGGNKKQMKTLTHAERHQAEKTARQKLPVRCQPPTADIISLTERVNQMEAWLIEKLDYEPEEAAKMLKKQCNGIFTKNLGAELEK